MGWGCGGVYAFRKVVHVISRFHEQIISKVSLKLRRQDVFPPPSLSTHHWKGGRQATAEKRGRRGKSVRSRMRKGCGRKEEVNAGGEDH